MKHKLTNRIENLDIHEIETLLYYDGPIISVVTDGPQKYIISWADRDNTANRWCLSKVNDEQLARYKNGEFSLLEVVQLNEEVLFLDFDGEESKTYLVQVSEIPEDYLPLEDSYL